MPVFRRYSFERINLTCFAETGSEVKKDGEEVEEEEEEAGAEVEEEEGCGVDTESCSGTACAPGARGAARSSTRRSRPRTDAAFAGPSAFIFFE